MPITPEDRARRNIDKLLTDAGWIVQNKREANLSAGRGVAVGEFPMKSGHGEADYLLFLDGSPVGVVETKQEGTTLTAVELQTTKYSEGIPDHLHAPRKPLPFLYQSTGVETRFTNLLEPDACSRSSFGFHRPETLNNWAKDRRLHRQVIVRLTPKEFLAAWIEHIPERYEHAVRSFGMFAPRTIGGSLAAVSAILGQSRKRRPKPVSWSLSIKRDFGWDPLLDRKGNRMAWTRRIAPQSA